MIKNKKLLLVVSVVILIAFVLTACGSSSAPAGGDNKAPEQPKVNMKISLAAASPGGALYVIGSGIAKLLSEKASIDTSVESTGGSQHNQQLIDANQATVGLLTTNIAQDAWTGTGKWTNGQQLRNARAVLPMFATIAQIMVRKDSKIVKFSDLNGKTVSLGPAGSAHDVEFRKIFDILGVKPAKILNLPLNDTMDQIRDRKVDAVMMVSTVPNATMGDFSTTIDAAIVPFTEDEVKKILAQLNYFSAYEVAANSYKGQDQAFKTVNQWCFLGVHKDQPEDFVYTLTKTIAENWNYLETASAATKGVKPAAIVNVNIPLHPGAIKYFKEIGVQIPDKLIAQ